MGGDRLDARLEPIAEFLLIFILLLVVAAVTSFVLTRAVQRRRERAHNKLSGSRRTQHSKIDLFAKADASGEGATGHRHKHRRRSGSSSSGGKTIDILKGPGEQAGIDPAAAQEPSRDPPAS